MTTENTEICTADVQSLLEYFSKNMYRARIEMESGSLGNDAMQKCAVLMKEDYNVVEMSNQLGELSSHYPSLILIPEYEKVKDEVDKNVNQNQNQNSTQQTQQQGQTAQQKQSDQQQPNQQSQKRQQTIYENTYDANKLRDLINKARFARCRARFPIPIILYRGKYVCRSSTLSGGPEIYTRSGIDYLFAGVDNSSTQSSTIKPEDEDDSFVDTEAYEAVEVEKTEESCPKEKSTEWTLFNTVRSQDIKLLKTFNVGTIVDFMVENKKVKFMMNVTSSEKIDKERRYAEFKIISLPYPGCEFFRKFRDNNYSGEDLIFDWTQTHVDANIGVPIDEVSSQLTVNWNMYKEWDLVQITQNYLKLLIKYLHESNSGLLIHCISGWDRTPLFVSLLRLSLWADGVIHQSLNAIQMLYFTIAYDWLIFGHNLPDRLGKGEDIFFFCFYALKYIMDDEFSILGQRFRSKNNSTGSSSIGVIRADSDTFEGMIFENDESRGSSISLSSTCSAKSSSNHTENHQNHHLLNLQATSSPALPNFSDESNGNRSWVTNSSSNSIGCVSNDSVNFNNWSPQLQKKRTSPVSVPCGTSSNNGLRNRQESTSSASVGSWQMISQTGSLRSQDSNIIVLNEQPSPRNFNINNGNGYLYPQQPNQSQPQSQPQSQQQPQNSTGNSSTSANPPTGSTCTIVDDDCFTANEFFLRKERLTAVRTLFYNCYSSTIGFKFKNGNDSALGNLLGNFAEKVGLARTSI